jgi:His/Glu/Gln/Arg/opine family amino acid ABC transporter permease subunit
MLEAFEMIRRNAGLLAQAFLVTVELNLLSVALALLFGIAVGIGRMYGGRWLERILGLVVDVVRSIPILVILVWTFFGLPLLLGVGSFPPFVAAVLALGVHSGVYIAEIVRGGLGSVRAGQQQAAIALGMTWWQSIWRVVLPQAAIRMLPPIGSRVVRNLKDSVLAGTIAVQELFWAGNMLEGETAKPFPIYTSLMIFYWPAFWESFPRLLPGLIVTVQLTLLVMPCAVILGLVLALLRLYAIPSVAKAATAWVELWRATPLLLQLYWLYYVMPAEFGLLLPAFATVAFGLTCNVSAFLSENFRAGIASIRLGQRHAALALGMSEAQAFWRVVLPQAFSRVLPETASSWVELFKETSLVSTLAVADLTYLALALRNETYRTLEVLTALALLYLILAYPQAKLSDWLYRRMRVKE